MFNNVFFGTFIILLGISIIFGISLIRPLIGLFLIYLGVTYLIGCRPLSCKYEYCKHTIFSRQNFKIFNAQEKYSVIFGQAVIDLSDIDLTIKPTVVHVKSVFANTIIKINPEIATKIKIKTVAASVQLPNDNVVTMGHHIYKTKETDDYDLIVKVKAVFSNVVIKNK
ncbi:hypothetical protein M1446_03510 [Candidatus Dependentiae bacterium]|nr:hypothetical protein [Candidatus Dependentiae bacterium]